MWNNTLSFLTLNTHNHTRNIRSARLTPPALSHERCSLLTCATHVVIDCALALSAGVYV